MARIINLCILFAISFSILLAQTGQVTVSGTVTDEKGFPMSGVTVQLEGSTIGTVTDANGNFSLKAPLGSTILFSFVGFVPEKREATASPLQIVMKEDVIMMSEVVVTALGMGREKKEESTCLLYYGVERGCFFGKRVQSCSRTCRQSCRDRCSTTNNRCNGFYPNYNSRKRFIRQ